MNRDAANAIRHRSDDDRGHYESYFMRANHPREPLAFWIRYTIFVPRGRPEAAVGEQWAMFFDGTTDQHAAVKTVHPFDRCAFDAARLGATIDGSELDGDSLVGNTSGGGHALAWDLRYTSPQSPLLLLKPRYYDIGFPKAKALVGSPNAVFDGTLRVDDREVVVNGWVGSQNHNWGLQHTDRYAWGQVAGFDEDPEAFLECSTAQIKLGPVYSPRFTLVVLRLDGEEHRFNGLRRAVLARGRYEFFRWTLDTQARGVRIRASISAPGERFVALPYDNPPGGVKTCLNSKLASCTLTIERPGRPIRTLTTAHRAAFEILTDRSDHGVRVLAAPSSA